MRVSRSFLCACALSWPLVVEGQPAAAPAEPASQDAGASEAVATEPAVAPVPVAGATPEYNELNARILALSRVERLEDGVQRPLDFARAALERSRASTAAGDATSALRTRQLARAALELAEARLRLTRERALFVATQARRNASLQELASEQKTVARERERALELQRESTP